MSYKNLSSPSEWQDLILPEVTAKLLVCFVNMPKMVLILRSFAWCTQIVGGLIFILECTWKMTQAKDVCVPHRRSVELVCVQLSLTLCRELSTNVDLLPFQLRGPCSAHSNNMLPFSAALSFCVTGCLFLLSSKF